MWKMFCLWIVLVLIASDEVEYEHFRFDIVNKAILVYNEAIRLHSLNDIAGAIASYRSAISINNQFPQAHQNIAILYDGEGEYDRAKYHHERSIEFAPNKQFKAKCIVNLVNLIYKHLQIKSAEQLGHLLEYLGKSTKMYFFILLFNHMSFQTPHRGGT